MLRQKPNKKDSVPFLCPGHQGKGEPRNWGTKEPGNKEARKTGTKEPYNRPAGFREAYWIFPISPSKGLPIHCRQPRNGGLGGGPKIPKNILPQGAKPPKNGGLGGVPKSQTKILPQGAKPPRIGKPGHFKKMYTLLDCGWSTYAFSWCFLNFDIIPWNPWIPWYLVPKCQQAV